MAENNDIGFTPDAGNSSTGFTSESMRSQGMGDPTNEQTESGRMGGMDQQKGRIADQLDRVGDTLTERARTLEEHGGVAGRAAGVVRNAGDALGTGSRYIRDHDVNEMRGDLETAIRENPLMSVGIALGAGFILSRILD